MNLITAGHAESPSAGYGPPIDVAALRAYRYGRIQRQLRDNDCAAALLLNPINIRYATDSRNMTVWLLHNMGRYCLVPAEGRAVLFEYANKNCLARAAGLPFVGEVRPVTVHAFFDAAEHALPVSRRWAREIRELVEQIAGAGRQRLAIDRADLLGAAALRDEGLELVEGQRLMELARAVKSAEEIACMRESLAVADLGMQRMRAALAPGISERELWAELHHANIANGGEWIETMLLCSGPRTNPWFQEASARRIEAGDLVGFDTDMVGPHGYCSDVSRTFLCGDGPASAEQRALYALAVEQVQHNTALLRPGLAFRDYTANAWRVPARFREQDYGCIAHGVGMVDEWPAIYGRTDDPLLQDGVFEPGMTVCVESYIGEVGGREGVKLEDQVLITSTGHEVLSGFALETALL